MNFTRIEGMRAQVTDIDILSGIGGDCERCPIALAISRVFCDYQIHVSDVEVCIHQDGTAKARLFMTDSLWEWVDTFDNENTVQPIHLEIRNSSEIGYQYELALVA